MTTPRRPRLHDVGRLVTAARAHRHGGLPQRGGEGRPSKICARCGRRFEWRRAWARDWEQVRYCSGGCRRGREEASIVALEQAILGLLSGRPRDVSICPSQAARAVAPDDWRRWMEPARAAARRLAATGRIEITQRGRVVDPAAIRGLVRLRRR